MLTVWAAKVVQVRVDESPGCRYRGEAWKVTWDGKYHCDCHLFSGGSAQVDRSECIGGGGNFGRNLQRTCGTYTANVVVDTNRIRINHIPA